MGPRVLINGIWITRNSKRAGENGPPRGPEKATLLAGVTINDGGDGLPGFSSAPADVNSSIANMPRKVNEARMAIVAARKNDIALKNDTQLV
jgi:hypothetical protein